jgi:hypothetical protein
MFYVLCFMFYVLCFMFYFGLDFYDVCMCWIMDLECLYLVLRLWQRCIVTRLGPRQSSRLSFFPTRRLRRRLLLSRFSIASPLSSPVVVSSFSVTISGLRLLRRSPPSPSFRNLHLGLGLRPSTLGSSSVVLVVVGSRVDSRP